ncbi:MAG TPA: VOC family protein [bacterium]|nr:VOC family protein [bacterium]
MRLLEQKGGTIPAPDRPRPSEAIWRVVPNVKSTAFDESRKFYSDFLGFKVGMDMGWIVTFVSPNNPTAQISILQSGRAEGHPDLSVEVSDVDEMYSKAVAGGFKIVYPLTTESWGVRRFFVQDPNGVVLNVMSHTRD